MIVFLLSADLNMHERVKNYIYFRIVPDIE